jgi:hypothetical protein
MPCIPYDRAVNQEIDCVALAAASIRLHMIPLITTANASHTPPIRRHANHSSRSKTRHRMSNGSALWRIPTDIYQNGDARDRITLAECRRINQSHETPYSTQFNRPLTDVDNIPPERHANVMDRYIFNPETEHLINPFHMAITVPE